MSRSMGLVAVALVIVGAESVRAQSASDARLTGTRLAEFVKTKGGSERGYDICWRVPATAFGKPLRSKAGYELHVHRGIAVLVRADDPGLLEVRRRGGFASLRGRVVQVPPSRREKTDPEFVVEVREVLRRTRPEETGTQKGR